MRALVAGALFFAASSGAQADVWADLLGHWQGNGQVRGMPAQIDLTFRTTLDGRGRHLAFANTMRTPEGKDWRFLAEALYQCDAAGACRGHWYDSRGMVLPLVTSAESDRVVVEWGDAASERGRTTYIVLAPESLAIRDEVLGADGVWKVFGETTVQRASAPVGAETPGG